MRNKHACFFISSVSFIAMLFFAPNVFGQSTSISEDEGFSHVSNDTVKKEIASFTIAGQKYFQKITSSVILKKLRLYNCSDSFVCFSDNFFSRYEWLITISSNPDELNKINSIRFIPYGKGPIPFPDSAFSDLYHPNYCIGNNKKKESNCKVFYSRDRKRIYIYMLNGSGDNKYEVTWIIRGKYYGRVVNKIL